MVTLSEQLSKGAKVRQPKVEEQPDVEVEIIEPRQLSPEELLEQILPIRVRPTLNSVYGLLHGGISTAMDYLRRHTRHPDHGQKVADYIAKFEALSVTKRDKFDMEAEARDMEIDPSELAGWVMMELHRFGRETANLIMAAHQEHIASRLVREALFNEDTNILERMGETHGLLRPKQPQTQVNVRASANSSTDSRSLSMQDAGLPSFIDDMARVPTLVSSQVDSEHLLPAGEEFTVDFSESEKEAEFVQR